MLTEKPNGASGPPPTTLQRQQSFSSFPSSRSPSVSARNDAKKGRSPQPPVVPEDEDDYRSQQAESTSEPTMSVAPTARLRSQYPANSSEKHVEYILVASFDIDRGSVMEHQYPAPISGDETMLAELMLPDQAHVRSQDWTIFFLHKDTSQDDEEREARKERRRKRREDREQGDSSVSAEEGQDAETDESSDESDDGYEPSEPPLVYVLNLVNTKQDNTVKRGAIVKAMAICTRHPFLHIYKPILLLALEEYFRAPVIETLASLYNALNDMDLSLLPKLSALENFVLQSTDAKEMFIEKFEYMIQQRRLKDAERNSIPSAASSISLNLKNYALPRDTHEFESKVLYNGIPVPIKIPTALSAETVGDFSLVKLIQTFSTPHSTQPQPFALHPHLTTSGAYTHPIMVLINALLTQKRVIFLGHNRPSGEVAEAVLAACALASGGLLKGFVRYAFPYTDLTKIDDLLKVPGFIAGVTNPVFAHTPEWWDLLCDLPTGRMKISPKIQPAEPTDGLLFFQEKGIPVSLSGGQPSLDSGKGGHDPTGDNQFMDSLLASISNRRGENAIRARWRSWILKFTRIAAAFEETVYGASTLYVGAQAHDSEKESPYGITGHGYVWPDEASRLRELAANVHRIEGWRTTRSYYNFIRNIARQWERLPTRGIDLAHQHDRLRCLRLSHEQSAAIYLAIARLIEDAGPRSPALTNASGSELDLPASASVSAASQTQSQSQTQLQSPRSPALDPRRAPGSRLQYDTILQLLAMVPENNAGLFYLALGLFHPRQDVRLAVVKLLEKIQEHAAGRHFWASLGRFAKLAYFRVKREEGHVGAAAGAAIV